MIIFFYIFLKLNCLPIEERCAFELGLNGLFFRFFEAGIFAHILNMLREEGLIEKKAGFSSSITVPENVTFNIFNLARALNSFNKFSFERRKIAEKMKDFLSNNKDELFRLTETQDNYYSRDLLFFCHSGKIIFESTKQYSSECFFNVWFAPNICFRIYIQGLQIEGFRKKRSDFSFVPLNLEEKSNEINSYFNALGVKTDVFRLLSPEKWEMYMKNLDFLLKALSNLTEQTKDQIAAWLNQDFNQSKESIIHETDNGILCFTNAFLYFSNETIVSEEEFFNRKIHARHDYVIVNVSFEQKVQTCFASFAFCFLDEKNYAKSRADFEKNFKNPFIKNSQDEFYFFVPIEAKEDDFGFSLPTLFEERNIDLSSAKIPQCNFSSFSFLA